MCGTRLVVILSISIYSVYLSPVLLSPYPRKNNFRRRQWETILRINAINPQEGRSCIYFSQHFISYTNHCALYIVFLSKFLLKNDLGRGAKVFFSLLLLSRLNPEILFHRDSYVHICLYDLLVIPYKKLTGKVKSSSSLTVIELYYWR